MSHTPGPWIVKSEVNGFLPIGIGNTVIADLNLGNADPAYPEHEARANARIIAAAPEMLSALERAIYVCTGAGNVGEFLMEVKIILAKARGPE